MKKLLLTSASAVALMLASAVPAQAENTAYGFYYSYSYGLNVLSFDMEAVNTAATTDVTMDEIPEFGEKEYEELCGGTSMGDGYLGLFYNASYTKCLGSFNMESNTMNVLRTYSPVGYESNGAQMTSLAYDASTNKLYAMEATYSEAKEGSVTIIYEMDPSTFELTEYTYFEGTDGIAIAAKDGDLYVAKTHLEGFWPVPDIFKLDENKQPTILVAENTDNVSTSAQYNSLAFDANGDLYLAAGAKMFKADLTAKTLTALGDTKRMVSGLTFTKSTKDIESTYEEPKDVRNLVCVTTFGTAMGDAPDTLDTKKTKYFYDVNNKLICMIEYARTYNSTGGGMGDYAISYIHRYEFDENGNVISHTPVQYGQYDYGDFAFRETINKEFFEYNEKGQKVKTTTSYNTTEYTYNEDGLLETQKVYDQSGTLSNTTTYYYFDETSNPTVVVTASEKFPESTFDNRCVVYGYDENGNRIGSYTKELGTLEDVNEIMGGLFTFAEVWEYNENNDMMNYFKFKYDENGEPEYLASTECEYVDGNPDEIRQVNYSYWNGIRTRSGLPQVYSYQTFNAQVASEIGVTLDLVKAEEPLNTVTLAWNLPSMFMTNAGKFDIYRDGLKIATKDMLEVLDMDNFFCLYGDTLIPNGNHQYFIQPLVGTGDEFAEEVTYTPYNTSNIANIEFDTELPAITDLHATDKYPDVLEVKDENGVTQSEQVTMLNLKWTNPADAEKFGFISNALMCDNFQLSENVMPSLEDETAAYPTFSNTHKFFIITRYNLGKAFSNEITVNLADVPDLTGIESVTAEGITVAVNGKVVEVSEAAHIAVFAMNGTKVAEVANATSLSLADAAAGAYIICVEKAGKVSTFKAVVK